MLILQYFLFGILSTLPLGPLGLHVVQSHSQDKRAGKMAIIGFIVIELIYMLVALSFQSIIEANMIMIKGVGNTMFSILLIIVGLSLLKKGQNIKSEISTRPFMKSLILGGLNPGILIFYTGLCAYHSGLNSSLPLFIVCLSFLFGGLFAFSLIFTLGKKIANGSKQLIIRLKKILGIFMIGQAIYLISSSLI